VSRYLRRDDDNPNTFIGIILLIVLGVFVGPNLLPEFLSDLSPYVFAGVPCDRLPEAQNLTAYQSVIGRSVQDPLDLEVDASSIGDDGSLILRLTITNASLGTIPIVYIADDVATTDDGSNGFGIIINPTPLSGLVSRQTGNLASYPEENIKMLGPRQKCVHSFEVIASPQMITNGGTTQAYYRITVAGQNQPPSIGTKTIFPDQGLDILTTGVIFSEVITIPPRSIPQG
jgi:hypothetical protein